MLRRALVPLATLVALAAPATAGAGQVNSTGTTLLFGAAAGETNHLTISENIGTHTTDFSDTGAIQTAGSCPLPGPAPHHLAQCSPYAIDQHLVSLLDGNDFRGPPP